MEYLKIKDDVDLTELEKFGFVQDDWGIWYQYYNGICVRIGLHPRLYRRLIFDFGLDIDDIDDTDIKALAIGIFDLTQAGLVEKIVE